MPPVSSKSLPRCHLALLYLCHLTCGAATCPVGGAASRCPAEAAAPREEVVVRPAAPLAQEGVWLRVCLQSYRIPVSFHS